MIRESRIDKLVDDYNRKVLGYVTRNLLLYCRNVNGETTLETSGKDEKPHPKRVEKMKTTLGASRKYTFR